MCLKISSWLIDSDIQLVIPVRQGGRSRFVIPLKGALMWKPVSAVSLLAFLSVGFQSGGVGAKELDFELSDGTKFTGEILSVRDGSLVVASPANQSQADLVANPHRVTVLADTLFSTIRFASTSHTVLGLFTGMGIGCIAGYAIGAAEPVSQAKNDVFGCNAAAEHSSNELGGATIGALGGGVLGAVVGGAASTKGSVLISPTEREFKLLNNVARYPATEPGYLKTIAP